MVQWLKPCASLQGTKVWSLVGELRSHKLPNYWEGKGNPLQYSCLEHPMDREAWWATVPGVWDGHDWSIWASMHMFLYVYVNYIYWYIYTHMYTCTSVWYINFIYINQFGAFLVVQFTHSVIPDSLLPHEPQHARPPCPSPTPRVHPNPCPSSRWCHPTIPSSVVPFSSCPPSFPASGSSQLSQLFASGGQSIGVTASTSVLPRNTQDWSPLGWTGWISLQSKGLSRVFSNTTVQKHQFSGAQLSL